MQLDLQREAIDPVYLPLELAKAPNDIDRYERVIALHDDKDGDSCVIAAREPEVKGAATIPRRHNCSFLNTPCLLHWVGLRKVLQ
jgi:hypothetical protein